MDKSINSMAIFNSYVKLTRGEYNNMYIYNVIGILLAYNIYIYTYIYITLNNHHGVDRIWSRKIDNINHK